MICTHAQLQYWRDSVTLFGRAVAVTRDNLRAEYNLGVVLGERGQAQEAMRHYARALEIKPNRIEAAGDTQVLAHENLGIIFAKQAKWPEAEVQFRAALDEKPGYWQARSNLGGCLEAMGRFNEAVAEYRKALDDGAQGSDVWRHLGIALVGAGRSNEAEKAYREAVRLNPGGVAELNELAWFLATDPHSELRNGPEAVVMAQRACELAAGSEPKCLGTLDAAYAEAGRFPEAMETAQQARAMFLSQGQNELADMASQRLELYRAGKPYRQQ